jgi:uncharacterized protein (TIGR02646 family)
MRKISKESEPVSLTSFKESHPLLKYSNLSEGNEHVRIDIRIASLKEQYYLCGYCCNRINRTSSHNEHIIPQSSVLGEGITLDFEKNIIASCEAPFHCGHKKGNNVIDLTPLMIECESEIVYQLNGKMSHVTPRAQSTINTLNLRKKALENKRKQIIDLVLFDYVDDLVNLALEEDYYLDLIINEISIPDDEGKLEAFSPVIINVLKQFIS